MFLNGDGTPRREPLPGDANYSDLFCAKGLLHAARALQDAALEREALAIWSGPSPQSVNCGS